jgi:dTDP-4-amino-4,6-dideoxygalactose transaminase
LHDHGRDKEGIVKSWGRNSRLDNLQAAILNYLFTDFDKIIFRRRYLASIYQLRLGGIEFLTLPNPPTEKGDNFDIYQNYEIQADRRDELKIFLANKGVGTLVQWGGKAIHQWEHLGFKISLPKVEKFFTKCIMLPMNYFISDDDVHYVCDKISEFYLNKI